MNKANWTLLAISLGGDEGLTPAQLQKVLFLMGTTYPKTLGEFYNFKPYNYGPFDKQIYLDAEALATDGLIEIVARDGNTWPYYCIREKGRESAKALIENEDTRPVSYMAKTVKWAQSLTFGQLVSSIYEKYPDYKVNSVFRG